MTDKGYEKKGKRKKGSRRDKETAFLEHDVGMAGDSELGLVCPGITIMLYKAGHDLPHSYTWRSSLVRSGVVATRGI